MPAGFDGRYALKNPGDGVAGVCLNGDINVFGSVTRAQTTYRASFPVIEDEPMEIEKTGMDQQWVKNLVTGLIVTAALAACAIFAVATFGVGAATLAVVGAAVGAAAVTASVAITDAQTGHGRSTGQFLMELATGIFVGAAIGMMMPTIAPYVSAALEGMGTLTEGFGIVAKWTAMNMVGFNTFSSVVVPQVAMWGSRVFLGLTFGKLYFDAAGMVTGTNVIQETVFGGDAESYASFSHGWNAALLIVLSCGMYGVHLMNQGFTLENSAGGYTYSQIMDKVENGNFSTPENGAVVYSGGPDNLAAARQFAEGSNGAKVLLEGTETGKFLNSLQGLVGEFKTLTPGQIRAIWEAASRRYVWGASGDVTAFVEGSNPNSIYMQVERYILEYLVEHGIINMNYMH